MEFDIKAGLWSFYYLFFFNLNGKSVPPKGGSFMNCFVESCRAAIISLHENLLERITPPPHRGWNGWLLTHMKSPLWKILLKTLQKLSESSKADSKEETVTCCRKGHFIPLRSSFSLTVSDLWVKWHIDLRRHPVARKKTFHIFNKEPLNMRLSTMRTVFCLRTRMQFA